MSDFNTESLERDISKILLMRFVSISMWYAINLLAQHRFVDQHPFFEDEHPQARRSSSR